jgi:hypothetical protein
MEGLRFVRAGAVLLGAVFGCTALLGAIPAGAADVATALAAGPVVSRSPASAGAADPTPTPTPAATKPARTSPSPSAVSASPTTSPSPPPGSDAPSAVPSPSPSAAPVPAGAPAVAPAVAPERRPPARQGSSTATSPPTGTESQATGGPTPDRVPAGGSQPWVENPPVAAAEPAVESVQTRLLHQLTTPRAGFALFVAGLVTLVGALAGLVSVGVQRRRW